MVSYPKTRKPPEPQTVLRELTPSEQIGASSTSSHFHSPRESHRQRANKRTSTFSPEGRLFQVEYSLEAIKLGSTAIGVATSEGVVLGVEKRVTSTLLETSSVEKIVEIDRHIGCAMSGLQADARSMVEHARVECQSHAFNYAEPLRVESCTQAICDLALRFGESADGGEAQMSRPFGVALLIAGYDEDGPSLYHAEPSGTFYRYDAKAIGSGSEGAQAELQNEYHKVILFMSQ
jgi:20S proteasome subunit alpha 5